MRSPTDDRTSRAILRDEALRLFGEHGVDGVTVRQVAAAAGVSGALLIRHYGSKDGLRAAVDDYVVTTLEGLLAELAAPASGSPFNPAAASGLVDAMLTRLPSGSDLPRYLARMLIDGGPAARAVFLRLHESASGVLAALVDQGLAVPGADPVVRAAVLLSNDLAVFMLRDRIAEAIGADPLGPEGMRRWARELTEIYLHGLGDGHELE